MTQVLISQSLTVLTITAAAYTTAMQSVYNQAYGSTLGLYTANTWATGTTVFSTAASTRRSAVITFTAKVIGTNAATVTALGDTATAAATAMQTNAATFVANLNTANQGCSGGCINASSVPTVSQLTVNAPTATTSQISSTTGGTPTGGSGTTEDDDGGSTGVIIGVIIGALVLVGAVGGGAYYMMNKKAEGAGDAKPSTEVVVHTLPAEETPNPLAENVEEKA